MVGIKQATNSSGNAVLAITASKEEYDAYIKLVDRERARCRSPIVAYFGDIYLTNPKLLPDFDVVTHVPPVRVLLPEHRQQAYGGLTDEKLLDLFTAKTKKGGHILFYMGSMAWNKARAAGAEMGEARAGEARRRFQDAAGVSEDGSRARAITV